MLNHSKIKAMTQAGQIIAEVKKELRLFAVPGKSLAQIDQKCRSLIEKAGAQTNFDLEPGYQWSACVNLNAGICHGIPHPNVYLNADDVVKIDLGCIIDGWNVDTAFSFIAGQDPTDENPPIVSTEQVPDIQVFLNRGRQALKKAILAAQPGNSIYDISLAMEKALTKHNYDPVFQLVGHGIGRQMHEDPLIPCVAQAQDKRLKLAPGQTIAVEAMYAAGNAYLVEADDGWTYATADNSLTGYFEETIMVPEKKGERPTVFTDPEFWEK